MKSLRPSWLLLIAFSGTLAAHAQTPAPDTTTSPQGVPPTLSAPSTAPIARPLPPNRWTPAQIREAFQLADANGDGLLTRGEAQRLAIMPRSFEDTDTNKDGVISLEEYTASFGP